MQVGVSLKSYFYTGIRVKPDNREFGEITGFAGHIGYSVQRGHSDHRVQRKEMFCRPQMLCSSSELLSSLRLYSSGWLLRSNPVKETTPKMLIRSRIS